MFCSSQLPLRLQNKKTFLSMAKVTLFSQIIGRLNKDIFKKFVKFKQFQLRDLYI